MNSGPNRWVMAAIAGPPGAVVAREIASASMLAAPRSRSIRSTVLLPLPMPPVSPTRIAGPRSEADHLQDCGRAEHQSGEPRAGEEGAERHVAAVAQLAGELHPDAN